jgi:uncharacterized protein (DUF362 family)
VSRNAGLICGKSNWVSGCALLLVFWAAPCGAGAPFPRDALGRSRIVVVRDEAATQAFDPRPERLRPMVDKAITNLTGRASVAAAWRSLVSTQDIIGLKVYAAPGPRSGTRPAVVAAIIEGLLEAGIPPRHLIIWDKHQEDLREAGFEALAARYGARAKGSAEAGYDELTFYELSLLGQLVWGDLEFGKRGQGVGRKSFVSKLVTKELTKIINVTPLLNHNRAGVTGNLYGLAMGSVDNTRRFEADSGRLANAVPEIVALPALGDRVVLSVVDALICQYEGEQQMLLHYSTVLNELRFSKDPVALDVYSIQELDRQRASVHVNEKSKSLDLYQNASLLELGTSDPDNIQVEVAK